MIDDLIEFMSHWPKGATATSMFLWLACWVTVFSKMLVVPSLISGLAASIATVIKG